MWTYKLAGILCVVLGAIGIPLPLLPTTPFLLLAAACFARSSPTLHQWLLNNAVFGPIIQDWEERRCINCAVKHTSIACTTLLGGSSVLFFINKPTLQIAGAGLIAIGVLFILRLTVCEENNTKDI